MALTRQTKLALLFVSLWGLFQASFSSGKHFQYMASVERSLSNVETRIALDLPKLKLANPKFRTVAHGASVSYYLRSLNTQLEQMQAPVRVKQLQSVELDSDWDGTRSVLSLQTADQSIPLTAVILTPQWWERLTPLALILAMAFTALGSMVMRRAYKIKQARMPVVEEPEVARLLINLHDKTLGNGLDDAVVKLPNKPFCFYAALVDYCLQQDEPYLNHNKDVPEELLALANKYFSRLIELGHTKRKRPDFSTNLDKTLSEIRTALEEVFHDYVEARDIFYPPKAQGEGSRSKAHNYALEHIHIDRVEILGK